jgi:hypothetical protein
MPCSQNQELANLGFESSTELSFPEELQNFLENCQNGEKVYNFGHGIFGASGPTFWVNPKIPNCSLAVF